MPGAHFFAWPSANSTLRECVVKRFVLSVSVLLGACNKSPAEVDAPARTTSEVQSVAPLLWEKPATWTATKAATSGALKASYETPKVGDDKAEANVDVVFFGTGALGDAEKNFKEWF